MTIERDQQKKNGQKNICSLRNGTKGSVNLAFEIVDSIRRHDRRHRSRVWETIGYFFFSIRPSGRPIIRGRIPQFRTNNKYTPNTNAGTTQI